MVLVDLLTRSLVGFKRPVDLIHPLGGFDPFAPPLKKGEISK